tara:strand:+ start:401 stop:766 length:366 start_codon:yes stop_codon:yes gene_type:complete
MGRPCAKAPSLSFCDVAPKLLIVLALVCLSILLLADKDGVSWRDKDRETVRKLMNHEPVSIRDVSWLFDPNMNDRLRAIIPAEEYAETVYVLTQKLVVSLPKEAVPVPAVQMKEVSDEGQH